MTSAMCRMPLALLLSLLAMLPLRAGPALAQTVATDKADYQPGEVLTVTGSGWQPGETVEMLVTSSDPTIQPDFSLISVAGDEGSFINVQALLGGADLGLSFTLTATGDSSGLTATTAFADGGQGQGGPPATCDTSGTPKTINVGNIPAGGANLNNFTCEDNEWHFVINQADSSCPASITVIFQTAGTVVANLDPNTNGPECGYTVPGTTVPFTDTVLSASTSIYPNWSTGGICRNGQFVLSHVPCQQQQNEPKITIVTDIHNSNHTVVTSVTMGATIHDKATVTGSGFVTTNPDPTGTVDFTLYSGKACTGTVKATYMGVTLGAGNPASAESLDTSPSNTGYLVLAADVGTGLSFKASYSGDQNYPAKDSDCEPLDVLSSISDFSYKVVAGARSPQAGPFTCTLETSTDTNGNSVPDLCAVGHPAADVTVSKKGITTSDYLVTVTVKNNTGVNILEKVQGGLAANAAAYLNGDGTTPASCGPGCLKISTGTCGFATINLSSAKTGGGPGNVVIWNGNGVNSPTAPGFAMGDGTTCVLTVIVSKGYSSPELQAVTSSWSELQTLLDGPNAGFSEKSPYTGSLATCVHNADGSVVVGRNTCNQ